MQGRTFACEACIRHETHDQVEIAAPGASRRALTGDADARTLVHTGGYLDLDTFRAAVSIRQFKDARRACIGFRQRHFDLRLNILSDAGALASTTRRSASSWLPAYIRKTRTAPIRET